MVQIDVHLEIRKGILVKHGLVLQYTSPRVGL